VNVRKPIDGLELQEQSPIDDKVDPVMTQRLATVRNYEFLLARERNALLRQLDRNRSRVGRFEESRP
jgi:hypothetical protein